MVWVIVGLVPVCGDEISIPDAALSSLLQEILQRKGIEKDVFEAGDLAKIHFLDGRSKGIVSLDGLQHCSELQEIHLDDNNIASVAPLAGCLQVRSLSLSGNKLQNIEALSALADLRLLNIENNSIADIAPLSGMLQLTSLFANQNGITDLSALQAHPRLHTVFLANNQISDITPLGSLGKLSTLDLRHNKIVDVAPLGPLQQLRWTFLSDNQIADLAPLAGMVNADTDGRFAPFWRLYLERNPLSGTSTEHLKVLSAAAVVVVADIDEKPAEANPDADSPVADE